MKWSAAAGILFVCGTLPCGVALAQAVEQVAPVDRSINIPTPVVTDNAADLNQLAPTAAELGSPTIHQAASKEAGTPVQQMSGTATKGVRIADVPPEMVDACAEAAMGRRAPPKGVDCTTVLEAKAPPGTSDLPGQEPLTAGVRSAGNEVSIRRLENASPEEIARRLASGYLVNAPAAQAIGAGETQTPPPGSGVVVIPDPSRGSDAPPPVIVNPGRQ